MDFAERVRQLLSAPVKTTTVKSEFDFEDPSLFDQVLGRPNKIDIPERYIPDVREPEELEEEIKRSQTADRLRRLLSKSNCSDPLPVVLPDPSNQQRQQHTNLCNYGKSRQSGNEVIITSGQGTPGKIGSSDFELVNNSFTGTRRVPLPSILKKKLSYNSGTYRTRSNSSKCDWSLAGVKDPSSSLAQSSNSSSFSSTFPGSSSLDQEELLHLQQNLAREVAEKSRLIAIRASATSTTNPFLRYTGCKSTPPSPIQFSTVDQLERSFD